MPNRPSKIYIAYKSDKECYRIEADDYQIHDELHKLFLLDSLTGSFPVSEGWVIMPDEFISDESQVVKIISEYLEYRGKVDPEIAKDFTESQIIRIWWRNRK